MKKNCLCSAKDVQEVFLCMDRNHKHYFITKTCKDTLLALIEMKGKGKRKGKDEDAKSSEGKTTK